MQYKRLGAAGLKVSTLWLGGMSFGAPERRSWVIDEAASLRILAHAIDAGINVIDTCDVYCEGLSEEIIGRFLKERGIRDQVVLATKCGWRVKGNTGVNQTGFSRKYIIEACERSLKRLQTDYIDLYQTHIWDPQTNIDEMVSAFDRLVQDGKVRYVGATDMPAWQFAKALFSASARGRESFVSMQHHYNAIWREDERELMPLCRSENVALVPYSPLGRGFLVGARDTVRARGDDKISDWYSREADQIVADEVLATADRLGVPPAAVALGWVLSTPGVVSTVVGIRDTAHLDQLIAHLDFRLSDEDQARIDAKYVYRPSRAAH